MPLLYFAPSIIDGGIIAKIGLYVYLYRFYWGSRTRASARENGGSSKLFFMTRQQKESQPGVQKH